MLRQLCEVPITADDLLEEGNQSCLICLEDQVVGGRGSKLPCGHLYCLGCLRDWLQRCCTCPSCRFELETDDPAYEGERFQRMKMRKQRYRPEELHKKTLKELRTITKQLDVNIDGCLEKREIVQRLLDSGKIQVLEETHVELSLPSLEKMSVGELRKIMLSLGVSIQNCLEKSDMIEALSRSNKVVITVPVEEQVKNPYNVEHSKTDAWAPYTASPKSSSTMYCNENRSQSKEELEASLNAMGIGDLKALMNTMDLSPKQCLEKSDMIRTVLEAKEGIAHYRL